MDIVKLVKRSKRGNKSAFSNLIKICEKDLYRVAIAITKNDDDALDCIQEAIVQAYTSIDSIKNDEYFKTWIIKILINKCNALIKKNQRAVDLNEKLQKEEIVKEDFKLEVKDSINHLEEDLKVLVVLYYYEDMSVKDISENLKIPDGTVKSRLSRARSKLKEMLSIDEEVL